MKRIVFLLFFFNSLLLFSQPGEHWGIGAEAIYNFQTNGIGAGVRAVVPVNYRIAISPQIFYFFPFNDIHEFYAGGAVQYSVLYFLNWNVYALGGIYYNRWINYTNFEGKIVKPNNMAEEVGIGLSKSESCLKPFIEYRYDIKWKEQSIHLGILYSFGDCNKPHLCNAY